MPLDDVVSASPAVGHGNDPQTQRYEHEPQDLIEEVSIGQNQRAIVQSLLDCVVSRADSAIIVGTTVEDGEFLVKVAAEERQE